MLKRTLAIALGAMLGGALQPALAEDLLQIYREAVANDPTLASARASWEATREVVPQARAGLLPSVTLSANANRQNVYEKLHTDPSLSGTENFPAYNYSVSASQPLYRRQNLVALDQAKQTLGQSDYVLASARQDLIVRVAQAYLEYLYSPEGQEIAAKRYYRPRSEAVTRKYGNQFPKVKLFTLAEIIGGWQKTNKIHFADGGLFDQIYQPQ